MRKVRSLLVGLMTIFAITCLIVARRPSNEIDSLRPYVIGEEISFMRPDNHLIRAGKKLPAALESHTYFLRDVSEQQLVALLNRSVASRRQDDGWYVQRDPYPELYEREWMYNATARQGYGLLNGYRGFRPPRFHMPRGDVAFTVIDTVPISSVDLLRYRLLHHGEPKW